MENAVLVTPLRFIERSGLRMLCPKVVSLDDSVGLISWQIVQLGRGKLKSYDIRFSQPQAT